MGWGRATITLWCRRIHMLSKVVATLLLRRSTVDMHACMSLPWRCCLSHLAGVLHAVDVAILEDEVTAGQPVLVRVPADAR